MGGGDLNTKKAWHPSTFKNQERVWKAEQAAAEEQKRILELQRERAQERDREDLNKLARQHSDAAGTSDNRLSWMYDQKPDKRIQQEDYLLGKAIDKNYDNAGKSEQNEIPAVSRRVVGSSMITTGGDTQVDLTRKLREDPLLLVKERERAARAALLNNPVQRKKLTELLRKEQAQKNLIKSENKSKKKDLDNLLAAKLSALSGEKGMNIAKLLESSNDSSSDSSSEEEKSKKKKKKKKSKSKKRKRDIRSESPVKTRKSKKSKKSKLPSKRRDNDSETELSPEITSEFNSLNKFLPIKSSNRDNTCDSDAKESSKTKDKRGYSHHSKSPKRQHEVYNESSNNRKEIQKVKLSQLSPNQEERKQRKSYIAPSPNREKRKKTKRYSESSSDQEERKQQKSYGEASPDREKRKRQKHAEVSPDWEERKQNKRYGEASSDRVERKQQKHYSDASPDREERKHYRESNNVRNTVRRETNPEFRKRDREGYRPENKRIGLSEEEKSARLAAMVAAGAEREVQRGRRVAAQLAENAAAEKSVPRHLSSNEARVLPDSLESRIHSNRHYLQRDQRHMSEHFARR